MISAPPGIKSARPAPTASTLSAGMTAEMPAATASAVLAKSGCASIAPGPAAPGQQPYHRR